ncbi:MAG TPA: hypothetical protein VD905_12075 [Flavobacteriales bacterium]|nr:hypothetical protein [Flavobacteriales bacterium]
MRKIILITFVLWASLSTAQTKIIAFKSHGGSATQFAAEFRGHFEFLVSNLGLGPQDIYVNKDYLPEVDIASSKNKQLDSVKYVSDLLTLCYISQYDKVKKKWVHATDSVKAVDNFNRSYSLASIKTFMRSNYFFKNSINTVKFIGFEKHSTKNNHAPFAAPYSDPSSGNKPFVILILAAILLLAAFFSWRSYKTFQPR